MEFLLMPLSLIELAILLNAFRVCIKCEIPAQFLECLNKSHQELFVKWHRKAKNQQIISHFKCNTWDNRNIAMSQCHELQAIKLHLIKHFHFYAMLFCQEFSLVLVHFGFFIRFFNEFKIVVHHYSDKRAAQFLSKVTFLQLILFFCW